MNPRRILHAFAAGALALGGALAVAAPASADDTADPAKCEGGYRTSGGYELIDLPERYVPPPLRGTAWDCAAHTANWELGDHGDAQYLLYWIDIEPEAVIDILARFEQTGWYDDEAVIVSNSEGRSENDRMSVADLRAWDPLPGSINTRFGDRNTGNDIIHFTYGDGTLYQPDPGFPGQSVLMIDVIVTGDYDLTGVSDPSVLSGLRTIAEAAPSPTQAAALGGTAVFLTLLVALPGYLVDTVLDRRWAQLRAWWRLRRARAAARKGRPTDAAPAASAASVPSPGSAASAPSAHAASVARPARRQPSWLVWPGFAAASFIACFIDPSFGVNPLSVRLFLTMFLSLSLVNVVGWYAAAAIVRRIEPGSQPRITFRWGSLPLVAGAVLFARLLDFEPGAVFGIVAGLTFVTALAASREALVVLVGVGMALLISAVAWVGYSAFAPLVEASPDAVVLRAATETLSAVVVEGVSTLPLALLPLAALDGAVVFGWRKLVWFPVYLVGVAAFGLVTFTIPEAWSEVGDDYLRWVLVFVVFAALATGAWGLDLWLERRKRAKAQQQAVPVG
ncbi:hypothetical protein H4J02_04045 [Protaetiibacter sp. SSC-01]|uniref:hypothetical protein n=1 Tax=Protaetiibacter sp. SSC-01 TaxID=2759943 RepID=UPI001656A27E|nr:hypothetical protein [Protaetiibacter sp. SSC-01]QNO38206.1 hypothetical protein H4J02_04045 [Protaetiibacter sp. SSC-01]